VYRIVFEQRVNGVFKNLVKGFISGIVERADASVRIIKETLPKVDDIGYIAYELLDGKLIRSEAIKVFQMTA
jgi:hypothetical protein